MYFIGFVTFQILICLYFFNYRVETPFPFHGSLKTGIEELGRIKQELQNASQELESSLSEEESISSRGSSLDLEDKTNHCIITAVQSSIQTQMILNQVHQAFDIHEKNMISRAGCLSRKSQESFCKMNPLAIQRLSSSSSTDSLDELSLLSLSED